MASLTKLHMSKFLMKISDSKNELGLRKVKNYKIYKTSGMLSQSPQLQSLGSFHWSTEVGRVEVGNTETNKQTTTKKQASRPFPDKYFLTLSFFVSLAHLFCFLP